MSFFEPISGADFDQKLEQARSVAGARIIDVRSAVEFAPKDAPLYLYCRSGARSARGCKALEKLGFTNVTNLGGILDYKGPVEA